MQYTDCTYIALLLSVARQHELRCNICTYVYCTYFISAWLVLSKENWGQKVLQCTDYHISSIETHPHGYYFLLWPLIQRSTTQLLQDRRYFQNAGIIQWRVNAWQSFFNLPTVIKDYHFVSISTIVWHCVFCQSFALHKFENWMGNVQLKTILSQIR